MMTRLFDDRLDAARRRAQYTPARAPADPVGRIAIVIDDGIAAGASMIAALHAVRAKKPARLVCATVRATVRRILTCVNCPRGAEGYRAAMEHGA